MCTAEDQQCSCRNVLFPLGSGRDFSAVWGISVLLVLAGNITVFKAGYNLLPTVCSVPRGDVLAS